MVDSVTEFGGEERFAAGQSRLFALLTDLDSIQESIPDLVSSERSGEQTLRCVVRPGFSFLRGTLKLVISINELVPPSFANMSIGAQGIGVSMRIVSQLQIEPDDQGSRLTWRAHIEEMKGLIATVSPALVRAAADHTIRHAWQQVRVRLGE